MGEHNCLYYHSPKDVCGIVASFFKEGLKKNEFCLWIVPEPLEIEDAKAALRETIENLDEYLAKGQLEIIKPREWYTPTGEFNSEKVLDAWAQKERQAAEQGFSAVCASGDGSWFPPEKREELLAYEGLVHKVITKSKMSALCTYSAEKFSEAEMAILSAHHDVTLSHIHGTLDFFNKDRRVDKRSSLA